VPLSIGVHHVSEEHVKRRHRALELGEGLRARHVVPLAQPSIRFKFSHAQRKQFAVKCRYDWAMMRLAHGEFARLETRRCFDSDLFDVLGGEAISIAVFVREWTT